MFIDDMFKKIDCDRSLIVMDVGCNIDCDKLLDHLQKGKKTLLSDFKVSYLQNIGVFLPYKHQAVRCNDDNSVRGVSFPYYNDYEQGGYGWFLDCAMYTILLVDFDGNVLYNSGEKHGYGRINAFSDTGKAIADEIVEIVNGFQGRGSKSVSSVTSVDEIVF